MNVKEKILIAFDFDLTIIENDTYTEITNIDPLTQQTFEENQKYQTLNWIQMNYSIFKTFKENKIDFEKIKRVLNSFKFVPEILTLFEYIKNNKNRYSCVVVSGGLDLLIKYVLEYNNLLDLFDQIYAHSGELDNDNYINYIEQEIVSCDHCSYVLCKSEFLKEASKKENYDKIIFVGDGEVDFCAAAFINENDYLFVRKNFDLDKKLKNFPVPCKNIIYWENGVDIKNYLKKI